MSNESPYYPDRFEEECAREDDECSDPLNEWVMDCGDPNCCMNFAPHFRSECHTPEMIEAMNAAYEEFHAPTVSVLFCHAKSNYKTLLGVDCWDKARNAQLWPGGNPCIAHPPCAQWGAMAHLAHINRAEKVLAIWAVDQVREWGGVLEHPASSRLWNVMSLPRPGEPADQWGGWTLGIHQYWWGHEADKATHLYIVGCRPADIPPIPMALGKAPRSMSPHHGRKELLKSKREHTPAALAEWLVELARRCSPSAKETKP